MVKSSPGVAPKPPFGPNLDSTENNFSRSLLLHRLHLSQTSARFRNEAAFIRYCHNQYCMLNDRGGNHKLRNVDCKINRPGVAIKEVLTAKHIID